MSARIIDPPRRGSRSARRAAAPRPSRPRPTAHPSRWRGRNQLAQRPGLQHLRVHRERVAREDHEVRVLAGLQAAHAILQVQHLRAVQGERGQRAGGRHARAHGHRAAAQEEAAVVDPVVGVDGHQHAGLLQHGAVLRVVVRGLELAAGRVDHDERDRHARGRDLRRHLPGLADVVQHHAEAELLREAQHGEHVVGAVGVVLHDAPAVHHRQQRFLVEVAVGALGGVAARRLQLAPVFLRLHVGLAHQRRRLAARAGEGRVALAVGAVGHLHAAHRLAVRPAVAHGLHRVGVQVLEVDGLAAHEVAAAAHHVEAGDAAGLRALEAGVADVHRVELARVRLMGALRPPPSPARRGCACRSGRG
jgi:hypothetical protein